MGSERSAWMYAAFLGVVTLAVWLHDGIIDSPIFGDRAYTSVNYPRG